jgi:hypothetical protein
VSEETHYREFEATFTVRFNRDTQIAAEHKLVQLRDYIGRAAEITAMSTSPTDLNAAAEAAAEAAAAAADAQS